MRWRDCLWPMMCVVATKGECLFVLLPRRQSVRFHYVEKGRVHDFSLFGRAVLHFPAAHIHIPTWLAQLLAGFSSVFQHGGSCKGGVGRGGWECLVGDVRFSGHHGNCV